jgi:transposase
MGVMKESSLKELLDEKLGKCGDEKISSGEAIEGMILNGLGFTSSTLSLSPRFFENRPLELLFREGVQAEDFNHYKLGRVLQKCYDYGAENLFEEIALSICNQEKVDRRFNSLDTTSFSVYYKNQEDDAEVKINLGHSNVH